MTSDGDAPKGDKRPITVAFKPGTTTSRITIPGTPFRRTPPGALFSTAEKKEASTEEGEEIVYRELKELSALLRSHDELYYNGDKTNSKAISDEEYDSLARREADYCKAYPHLLERLQSETGLGSDATRYGGRVGAVDGAESLVPNNDRETSPLKLPRISHLQRMLSLDNALDAPQLVAWCNRVRSSILKQQQLPDDMPPEHTLELMLEPKLDGLSLSLRYQRLESTNGWSFQLVSGATRGDGTRGEDVTDAVRSMSNTTEGRIPSKFLLSSSVSSSTLPPPEVLEVRGEVILPKSIFDQWKKEQDVDAEEVDGFDTAATENETNQTRRRSSVVTKFANARNAASGILLRSRGTTGVSEEEENGDTVELGTRLLRSQLRFYAYEIAFDQVPNNATDVNTTNDGWVSSSPFFASMGTNETGLGMREALTSAGFTVPCPFTLVSVPLSSDQEVSEEDCTELLQFHQRLLESREDMSTGKDSSLNIVDFEVDGAVYKLVDMEKRLLLGSTTRAPRWAIAHKFPPRIAATQISDLEVMVGRTGALTPVALLEPVDMGGVTVRRASLHNFRWAAKVLSDEKEVARGNLSVRRGETVLISRAGDVIPQVLKRVASSVDGCTFDENNSETEWISLLPPEKCPACGSEVVFDASRVTKGSAEENGRTLNDALGGSDDGAEVGQVARCGGPQLLCPPRAVGALVHAYSRPALDVTGLSEARIQQLMDHNILRVPSDLFRILDAVPEGEESMVGAIANLTGWGNKSAENLAAAAQSIVESGVPLDRYIYALGIRHVGSHSSKLIAAAYGTVSAFLQAVDDAASFDGNITTANASCFGILQSEEVKGIGPVVIESLTSFAREPALAQAAKELAASLTILDDRSLTSTMTADEKDIQGLDKEKTGRLNGLTVVFTGAIPGMSRSEAQNVAKRLGAKATPSSVSRSTDLVVVGQGGGKKANTARDRNIRIMEATEFLKVVSEETTV